MSEQRIVLSNFGIDHDADATFISGIVQSGSHFYIKNTRLTTITQGEAGFQASEMLMASWIKVGSEGHREIPSLVTLVIDGNGNIIRIEEGE